MIPARKDFKKAFEKKICLSYNINMSLATQSIIRILEKNVRTLDKYRVKRIGLFGSYSRGDQKKSSDVDILVEFDMSSFDENFSGYFDNYMSLKSTLRELLKLKVDLVTTDMISPYIKPYLENEIQYAKTA